MTPQAYKVTPTEEGYRLGHAEEKNSLSSLETFISDKAVKDGWRGRPYILCRTHLNLAPTKNVRQNGAKKQETESQRVVPLELVTLDEFPPGQTTARFRPSISNSVHPQPPSDWPFFRVLSLYTQLALSTSQAVSSLHQNIQVRRFTKVYVSKSNQLRHVCVYVCKQGKGTENSPQVSVIKRVREGVKRESIGINKTTNEHHT